jgi:hypothetical protein
MKALAATIATGMRSISAELRQQRIAIAQLQIGVVEYHRSVEQRDELRTRRLADLEAAVKTLQAKAAH